MESTQQRTWRAITNALPESWSAGYVHHEERFRRTRDGVEVKPDGETAKQECREHHSVLQSAGAEVVCLNVNGHLPDGVFVQDNAAVFWDFTRHCWVALVTNMGAEARKPEPAAIEQQLRLMFDDVRCCDDGDAILEFGDLFPPMDCGGDNIVFAGRREADKRVPDRTNDAGVAWVRSQLDAMGYKLCEFEFRDSLHATSIGNGIGRQPDGTPTVLVDGSRASLTSFSHHNVDAPQLSPPDLRKSAWGLNCQRVGDTVVVQSGYGAVEGLLDESGFTNRKRVPWTQLRLVDGSLTCCCIMQHLPI